ncbi:hypothetical protein DSO57_1021909 [Entomophthora muscae]|uniref:Uncharacterized protein n=1 Tax=Entomophthora muscae TaxID=34485 RepID=A0ACC2U1T8_9FUNG|nr:hypothetical protein DSO57_1021909 [Entomophthora muscae]
MHGLFGSKQNWSTLGKAFSQKLKGYTIYCLDSRNHGDSPHHEDMGYVTMANDVASFIKSLPKAKSGSREINLIGHSMGGRIAMTYALSSVSEPDCFPALHKLVVVDISPRKINLQSQFGLYTELMLKIDQAELTKQSDADKMLKEGGVQDIGIRQFLLTNLKKLPGSKGIYRFRNPLKVLNSSLHQLGESDPIFEKEIAFPCPTLFVAGSRSDYLKPDHHKDLKKIFTNSDLEFLDTGHWEL